MSLYQSGLRVFDLETWKVPHFFLRLFLFWIMVFAINRLVFILSNIKKLVGVDFSDVPASFIQALYLDTSAACYLLVGSFVFLLIQSFVNIRFLDYLHLAYIIITLLAVCALVSGELVVFDEWGTKLHYGAISHILNPGEIFKTAEATDLVWGISLTLIQFSVCFLLYITFFYKRIRFAKTPWLVSFGFMIITPPLVFLGIRGGWQEIPINQSDVYFSKSDIINLATVNSAWNLGHSIEQNKAYMDTNPYEVMPMDEARAVVDSLHALKKDTSIAVLDTFKPNVVFLILESWSADMMEPLGGYEGVTPFMNELCEESLLFTRMYSAGARSDQGMAAIFSGYPSQPTTSIIKQSNKFRKIPSINKQMKKAGYHSSFFFGGQLNYGNIKAYMMYNGFDEIREMTDFSAKIPQGKLGVHDEFVLSRQLEELQNFSEPFFSVVFTLSSHSPYDMPMEEKIDWGEDEKGYLNSVYYTDQCLKNYFAEARKQPWYDNTIFVIMADHSHNTPKRLYVFHPEFRHIPFLLYGEVLKEEFRGKRIDKLCGQTDIPKTLLKQLYMDAEEYHWSRDILNPYYNEFAYYGFVDGHGWVRPDSFYVYHKGLERYLCLEDSASSKNPKLIREGNSYLQVLFDEYLSY